MHGEAARYRCKDMLPGTGLAQAGARNLGPIIAEHTEYFALKQASDDQAGYSVGSAG